MPQIVDSIEDVERNIETYNASVGRYGELAARIKQHPAWYAIKMPAGGWLFGPSKFVGYVDADASSYLAAYSRQDGKETEPALRRWFEQVNLSTGLGRELREAFKRFAGEYDKTPNSRWRVSIPKEYLVATRTRAIASQAGSRIVFDPDICGGRPHIRGTRVRVSDIIAALAEGETAEELLADFPYLSEADIAAALHYAANALDHRVLVA